MKDICVGIDAMSKCGYFRVSVRFVSQNVNVDSRPQNSTATGLSTISGASEGSGIEGRSQERRRHCWCPANANFFFLDEDQQNSKKGR